jgi:hypothetical protein
MTASRVFTINRGSKTVGFYDTKSPYIIGFRYSRIARNVMHNLHPEPLFTLVRGIEAPSRLSVSDIKKHPVELSIDSNATLFIPKYEGSSSDPMNDGGFHMETLAIDDFVAYPVTKAVGVILPYVLIEENQEEFIYRSHVIQPCDSNIMD